MARTTEHNPGPGGVRLGAAPDLLGEVVDTVQIPLENVEYVIAQYLLAHGPRLDAETRILLAGVRDCVARVAARTRRLATRPAAATPVERAGVA